MERNSPSHMWGLPPQQISALSALDDGCDGCGSWTRSCRLNHPVLHMDDPLMHVSASMREVPTHLGCQRRTPDRMSFPNMVSPVPEPPGLLLGAAGLAGPMPSANPSACVALWAPCATCAKWRCVPWGWLHLTFKTPDDPCPLLHRCLSCPSSAHSYLRLP